MNEHINDSVQAEPAEAILGAVARGWCSAKNSGKEMDVDLAEAIAQEVAALLVAPVKLEDSEQYRMQIAGICTAAIGYWKESDSVHPDYDTIALRDVARLYAKYDDLYRAAHAKTAAPAPDAAWFSCYLQRDHGKAPCDRDCGKLRCMYPSAQAADAALNDAYAEGRKDEREANAWQPIETAPSENRDMFVVRAFSVINGFTGGKPYTSDAWAVWRQVDGGFARWPHHFAPTHWMPLPAAPVLGEPQ